LDRAVAAYVGVIRKHNHFVSSKYEASMDTEKGKLLSFIRILFLTGFLLLSAAPASADIGPKPSMQFKFEYEIPFTPILSGQQIECEDEACSRGQPLEELGPQGFICSENECSSLAYSYSDYHKLVIEFADGVRESNVFTKKAFSAGYTVTVTEDALIVKENFSLGSLFGRNCLCCSGFLTTLGVETLVASMFLAAFQLPRTVLGFVPIASLITLPLVWFAFPLLPLPAGWVIAGSEFAAVLLEAGFIFFAAFRRIPFRQLLLLSLVMNAISFGIGLLF
jgi:hypothetical protein